MKIRYKKPTGCCEGPKDPTSAGSCSSPAASAGSKEPTAATSCCAPIDAPVSKTSCLQPSRTELPKEIKKTDCCQPPQTKLEAEVKKTGCCTPSDQGRPARYKTVSTHLSFSDRLRHIRCRLGAFRLSYKINPGLYAVGRPSDASEVFISANYGLSFDILRSSLAGSDAWILVLDTKGINVWCAAGKGTFGTDEIIRQIDLAGLGKVVTHRRIIVPQLGGPGVSGHEVRRATGFKVVYGPVKASDIKAFVDAGYNATEEMRTIRFDLADRIVLTPMEIRPALKNYALFSLLALITVSITPEGLSYQAAWTYGSRLVMLGGLAVVSGAFITPALLPYIPSRSFAVKGFLTGLATTIPALWLTGWAEILHPMLTFFSMIFFPLASSYIALQFTGSSTYTGISGVKKELRYGVPVYITGAVVSIVAVAAYKLFEWGIL